MHNLRRVSFTYSNQEEKRYYVHWFSTKEGCLKSSIRDTISSLRSHACAERMIITLRVTMIYTHAPLPLCPVGALGIGQRVTMIYTLRVTMIPWKRNAQGIRALVFNQRRDNGCLKSSSYFKGHY